MTRNHLLLVLLVNALWGFNFIAGKYGTAVFGPMLFITLRFAIVLALLCLFLRRVPGQMLRIMAIGLMMGVGHYSFMFYGIYLAGSLSSVAITSQLTVPFATLLAIIFLGERIRWPRFLAIVTSFSGVVLIGLAPVGPEHLTALALTSVASLAMAISTILMRQLQGVSALNLQAWIALYATIAMGTITMILEQPQWSQLALIPLREYWTAAYSAIGATIVGHSLQYFLLQRYSVNSVAPFITLSTLFAIVFGIVLLDDELTLRIIIGGLLTLLGVTIVAIRNARENAPSGLRVPR